MLSLETLSLLALSAGGGAGGAMVSPPYVRSPRFGVHTAWPDSAEFINLVRHIARHCRGFLEVHVAADGNMQGLLTPHAPRVLSLPNSTSTPHALHTPRARNAQRDSTRTPPPDAVCRPLCAGDANLAKYDSEEMLLLMTWGQPRPAPATTLAARRVSAHDAILQTCTITHLQTRCSQQLP